MAYWYIPILDNNDFSSSIKRNARPFFNLELGELDEIQQRLSREGSAELRLWCAVLLRLYDDYRRAYNCGRKEKREYVLRYLNNYMRSKDFLEVCSLADTSPVWFRSNLRKKFPNNFDCFLRKAK